MSSTSGMSPAVSPGIARILGFLKSLYLRTQIDEVRRTFESLERELAALLGEHEGHLAEALDWIDGLSRTGPGSEPRPMPHVMAMAFAVLANAASSGTDGGALLDFVPSHRSQLHQDRAPLMRAVVRDNFSGPIAALEIGTWFGSGSTRIWIDTLPRGSSLFLVDAWGRYLTDSDRAESVNPSYRLMEKLPQAALAATARAMFQAEARPGNDTEFVLIRGRASRVLDLFRADLFDFIYIDGSHYYDEVKRDIALAKRLSKAEFSVVCGDDLETLAPELVEVARLAKDRDFIVCDGVGFHPGVTLAVSEEFAGVNTVNGFWWTIRREGVWGLS